MLLFCVVKAMWEKLFAILNALTFRLPYFAIRKVFSLTFGKKKYFWMNSPLKYIVSPVKLPDGNKIFWSWEEDVFWLRDMIKEIYEEQTYEHFFKAKHGEVIVDVGANIGLFTLKVSKEVGNEGKVITFEPKKRNYDLLSRNLRINKCRNVLALNTALSDFNGKATLYIKDVSLQNTLLPQIKLQSRTIKTALVDVRTLSSVLKELKICYVDILKIDAEGCELEVLRGAEEFLLNHRIGKISVAAYHSENEPKIITDYLHKFGYAVRSHKNVGLGNFQRVHTYGICTKFDVCA